MFKVKLNDKEYLTIKAILEDALMDNHYELSKVAPGDESLSGFVRETQLNITELNSILETFTSASYEKS